MTGYNLTPNQQAIIRWLVEKARAGQLDEEFTLSWIMGEKFTISTYTGPRAEAPSITKGVIDALAHADLLHCQINYKIVHSRNRSSQRESSRLCTITGKAYEAVDNNFNAPDTSFVTHLTPLADITNLDEALKKRCLPILGAGSADPALWDSAVRTAGVILEERLRDVGGVTDSARIGQQLVNDVFAASGKLAGKFTIDSERQGYRDLYAGIVGVFRNPSAHKIIDPDPSDGGAFIVFVNLLLKRLEALR
jgi:hypothetical protein